MTPDRPDNTHDNGLILLEKSDGLAIMTLNRPDKLNAMSSQMRKAFESHLTDIENDPDIHVVLIQAKGRAFCVGADTSELPDSPLAWRKRVMTAQAHHAALARMDKIVVAAVQGAVAGGGVSLALAADILIMADDATLHFPFVKLGLIPDGGCSFLLQTKLGVAAALDLMLTAGKMGAEEARQRGLTRRVVPSATLDEASQQLARELLALPPEALALTKTVSRQTWAAAMDASLSHEADAFALASTLPGHQQARSSLRAKRT